MVLKVATDFILTIYLYTYYIDIQT